MSTPHRDGSLWVYVPDSPADEAWLNPGVVQGPPGQQGPPGNEGPEGPPGTARILHLISAPTTIQTTAQTMINGWSFPVEAGRRYHVNGLLNISPSGNNTILFGLGGTAEVTVRGLVQYHGNGGGGSWNNTYPLGWRTGNGPPLGQTGGRLSCRVDGWVECSVAGTVFVMGYSNVNAPTANVNDGSVLEVISTTAARRWEPFGEVASAADPEWH